MEPRSKQSVLLAIILLSCASTAFAWGPEGHKIVAQIAADNLTANATKAVTDLLGKDSLADVANWADETRSGATDTWHFVDIHVIGDGSHDKFDPDKDCPKGHCVIHKVEEFTAILSDKDATKENRIKALKYLVHFVGDIHQPLHCADRPYRDFLTDRGGNEVHVHYPNIVKAVDLHAVWDGTIIKQELLKSDKPEDYADKLAKELETPEMKAKIAIWRKTTKPLDWALEAHALAVKYAYATVPVNPPPRKDPKLTEAYVINATPVVKEQLEKGGIRLADILNAAFP